MSGRSLSLPEAAEVLGASFHEVAEALRNGEFPGRFVVEGAMRIPRGDVDAARPAWHLRFGPRETQQGGTPPAAGLSSLRLEQVVSVLQEERRAWFNAIAAPLERHEERMLRVEDELRELRGDLKALGAGDTHSEWEPVSSTPDVDLAPSDFGGLVREIGELEALLNDLDLD